MGNFDLVGFLFAPQNTPFAISLGILGGLLAVEVLTVTLGMPVSQKLDAMLDLQGADLDAPDHASHAGLDVAHHDNLFGTAWDWLNAGRVPLLVLLMIMLAAFGSIGYMIEGIAHSLLGWLPTAFAAVPAFFVTLPVTRRASLLIFKIIPRDETYAVEAAGLVGLTGIIVTGPLTAGTIARVRIKDAHGNQHFPWVRTTDQSLRLDDGAHVLLVEQRGNEYLAVAADPKLID